MYASPMDRLIVGPITGSSITVCIVDDSQTRSKRRPGPRSKGRVCHYPYRYRTVYRSGATVDVAEVRLD